uniref:Sperm associated antigen 6 n=1 Tax=Fundulus heteroclitus TaxID=8078 RepID=A0A3Q2Q8Y8_FUNHE
MFVWFFFALQFLSSTRNPGSTLCKLLLIWRPDHKIQKSSTMQRFYKKAAAFVLRAVAKHSPELSGAVVDCGGVDALVLCLEEFDPEVKEAAAWALGCIARHNASLSHSVLEAGAAPLLVLCLLEPDMALKRIAASTLSDICKHTPELAQTVVDTGAIAHLSQMILSRDVKLKRQVFSALSQISKHSVGLAELVVEAEVFPAAFVSLKDPDEYVRKNVATLMREVAKQTPELSQLIVNCGGLSKVIDYLGESRGQLRLPGIMMLGYVAAHGEGLAMAVILCKGVPQLALCLSEEPEQHMKAAAVWSIGQIGHHTPEHAKAVATAGLLPKLLQLYTDASSSEDLQAKVRRAKKRPSRSPHQNKAGRVTSNRSKTNVSEQEGPEEHSTEVHLRPSSGAAPLRRSQQHPQARRLPVQQGAASRQQGPPFVRDQRGAEESPGDRRRAGLRAAGVHQRHQQLLPRGDSQVLLTRLLRGPAAAVRELPAGVTDLHSPPPATQET